MPATTLTIHTADGGLHLATLEWRDGQVHAEHLVDELAPAFARWREQGISEWIECEREGRPERIARVTTIADPEFLPRLAEQVRGQFNFVATLRSERNSIQTIAVPSRVRTSAGLLSLVAAQAAS